MTRYEAVHKALKEIEEKYFEFFEITKSYITQYVLIEPNETNDWINVSIKGNSILPEPIATDIRAVFSVQDSHKK
ncbi:hypothetical protein FO440_22795 [Mucilaginibacter corticis]|uniref:Uncharacterized protein n=1 Tax=Mucilaginibacter corticis TaxID=2597670 RepID=A0A556M924_9SPHI|nr:hypothetical protein [Mucilaginibacter corticis]TSJ36336.1 hypothetical protein FO440_22795 [Mucilaginibacter corticis]